MVGLGHGAAMRVYGQLLTCLPREASGRQYQVSELHWSVQLWHIELAIACFLY